MGLPSNQPNLLYGIIFSLGAYICLAIAATIVQSFDPTFPTIQIIFIQSIISLLFILPSFFKKKLYHFRKTLIPLHLVRAVAGIASFFCFFIAIKKMTLIDATVLTYTAPFYTPIIWSLWTKEKAEKGVWYSIILGFIGVALILKPTHHILKAGSAIGFSAGIFSSIALVAIKRLNQKMESLTRTLFCYFLFGTILTLPFAIISWKNPTWIQAVLLVSIGILMAVAQLFLTSSYRHGTASFLSPLAYSTIIFTGLISWIYLKQIPGWLSLIGGLLIIIGGTLSYIIKVKPSKFIEIFEHPLEEKIHWWLKIRLKHHHLEYHRHKKEFDED
jgi:drug/metabolite transporter (DMT)-like permease